MVYRAPLFSARAASPGIAALRLLGLHRTPRVAFLVREGDAARVRRSPDGSGSLAFSLISHNGNCVCGGGGGGGSIRADFKAKGAGAISSLSLAVLRHRLIGMP